MNDKKKTRQGKTITRFVSGGLVLTRDEFIGWLREHYTPTTMTVNEISEMFGISRNTIHKIMRTVGIKKTDEAYRMLMNESIAKSANTTRARWERYRNPVTEADKAERERLHIIRSETHKALWRKARLYSKMGLTGGPRLPASGHSPTFHTQTYYLRKKGYIVDKKAQIAYWTDTTKRCWLIEKEHRFFRFAKQGDETERKPEKVYVRPAFDGNIFYN